MSRGPVLRSLRVSGATGNEPEPDQQPMRAALPLDRERGGGGERPGLEQAPPTGALGPTLGSRPFTSWEQGALPDLWVLARPAQQWGRWGLRVHVRVPVPLSHAEGPSSPQHWRHLEKGQRELPGLPAAATSCPPPPGDAQATAGVLTHPAPSPAQTLDTLTPREDRSPGHSPHSRPSACPWEQGSLQPQTETSGSQPQRETREALFSKGLAPLEDTSQLHAVLVLQALLPRGADGCAMRLGSADGQGHKVQRGV